MFNGLFDVDKALPLSNFSVGDVLQNDMISIITLSVTFTITFVLCITLQLTNRYIVTKGWIVLNLYMKVCFHAAISVALLPTAPHYSEAR